MPALLILFEMFAATQGVCRVCAGCVQGVRGPGRAGRRVQRLQRLTAVEQGLHSAVTCKGAHSVLPVLAAAAAVVAAGVPDESESSWFCSIVTLSAGCSGRHAHTNPSQPSPHSPQVNCAQLLLRKLCQRPHFGCLGNIAGLALRINTRQQRD